MTDVLEKFRRLTKVFDPIYKPIEGEADSYYVAETHEDFRNQLDSALELNDNAKLLVAGQPGCGKTTLLRNIAQNLRKAGRIVAFVDLETCTSVQDLDPIEMYLAALAELLEMKESHASLSNESLKECSAWIAELQFGAEPPSEPSTLARILKPHLVNLRDSSELRATQRRLVESGKAPDPFEILCHVLRDLSKQRPVVILDGPDKIPPERAKETFLSDKKKPMAQAHGAAVVTIPISLVYEPTFNVLSERYNNADNAVLPAVRLWHFDPKTGARSPDEKGIDILRKIVAARVNPIDQKMLMPSALERAIQGSGGNIRQLARLMQASVVKAYARRKDRIESEDIEAAIADQRESFRRGYHPDFLPVLKRVHKESKLDDSTEIAKQLLYGLWVTEYRNQYTWYTLPEPVKQLLEQLEFSAS